MATFEHPEFLGLLLILPVLIWFRHFRRGRGATVSFALSNWRGSRFYPPMTWQGFLSALLSWVFWIGCAFMVIAVSQPSSVHRERVYLNRGIDMFFVLDCSPSMAAQDSRGVSRFDQARDTIRSFVKHRENDPVGIVAFGSEAQLRVPPTLDSDAVLRALDELHVMDLGEGTAIGLGLTLAAVHLERSSASQKIAILLTDGDNNAGEIAPETAAAILKDLNVRIYTIGIGTTGDVPLEYSDPKSGKLYRGTYRGSLNENLLTALASSTGGQYFHASSSGTLDAIFQSIDSIEKGETRMRLDVVKDSLMSLFASFGLLFILFDVVFRRLIVKELQ